MEEQLQRRSSWASAWAQTLLQALARRVRAESSRSLMTLLVLVHGRPRSAELAQQPLGLMRHWHLAFINGRIPSLIKVALPR